MSLARFFDEIGPFLEGRREVDEARRRLYGEAAGSRDAARLAIYGRFCRIHRFEALEGVYTNTKRALVAAFSDGESRWAALVEGYFRDRPMFHWELNENGNAFGEWLAARESELPPWLPALADFDWWEWRTLIAPDDPGDATPESGPLRLATTVEVRPYAWDLVAFVDEPADAWAPPAAREGYVVFWRDRDLDLRRADASPLELVVMKGVLEGDVVPPPGVDGGSFADTLDDLRAAGIVLGAP